VRHGGELVTLVVRPKPLERRPATSSARQTALIHVNPVASLKQRPIRCGEPDTPQAKPAGPPNTTF
jgi:hypothetical protein